MGIEGISDFHTRGYSIMLDYNNRSIEMKTRKKSFIMWIRQFKKDDTAIGDLARDIREDSKIKTRFSIRRLRRYLENANACEDCMKTFEEAVKVYQGL